MYVYELDLDDRRLRQTAFGSLELPVGAAPRYLDFHLDADSLYLLIELDSTLTAIDRDPSSGALHILESVSMTPSAFEGHNDTADVHVHDSGEWPRHFAITPDGEHLLVENEETNDVVTFAIDKADGTLSATGAARAIPSPVCLQFLAAE